MFSPDLRKGLFLASHELYPLDGPGANADTFLHRWDEYNLRNVLQAEGMSKHDEMLLLYALGYLADPDATALLLSFLPSQERSVRWISALSLGRQKQEVVFELLQEMLLEELLDFNFYLTGSDLTGNDLPLDDKDWYIERCREIIFVLGDWGKVAVAPLLRKAFVLCLEHESQCNGRFSRRISLWWRPLQKSLAYALGQ